MRNHFVTLVSSALLALMVGCGGGSDKPDMTVAPDLKAGGSKTCLQVATCAAAATSQAAINACVAEGTSTAITKYTALVTCGYGVCTKAGDAGAAACSSGTDQTPGCVACVGAAAQTNSTCSAQLATCASDS